MFVAANLAFSLNPMLTGSAITVIRDHASDAVREAYLEKLITAEWTGTMVLTESEAGSDVGALRAKAVPADDGTYRISGSKIFITWGDHDLADNVIHLVLARLPDAPPGTKGISLFVVPKMLVGDDGTIGGRNNVETVSIEHKLGIHASPTCVLSFDQSVGYLVGEPNRGMRYMFAMMNQARREVGLEGLGIAERAYQQAVSYAQERRQGRAQDADDHEDVQRGGTRPALRHRGVRRAGSSPSGRDRTEGCIGSRGAPHSGGEGLVFGSRRHGDLDRSAGAWRHGLRRGDGGGTALPGCPHHADL
jgi:acyl-CoA dehydrogenase